MPMPEDLCPICEGAGLRIVERADGTRAAIPCECRREHKMQRMLEQARIPRRYAHCTLENYETKFSSANKSLVDALHHARIFLEAYPAKTEGKGLLLVGGPGLGKTHLSVGLLRALIERGAQGLFVDYRDLLKQVQNSAHILNSRYNDQLTTIITTNFPNLPERSAEEMARMNEAQRIMSERTLGDRIGDRVLSRLQEMCIVVKITGKDFRQRVRSASFALEPAEETKSATGFSSPAPTAASEEGTRPNDFMKSVKREVEVKESAQRRSASLHPDRVWTQEDIDREVERKTRLHASRPPLD